LKIDIQIVVLNAISEFQNSNSLLGSESSNPNSHSARPRSFITDSQPSDKSERPVRLKFGMEMQVAQFILYNSFPIANATQWSWVCIRIGFHHRFFDLVSFFGTCLFLHSPRDVSCGLVSPAPSIASPQLCISPAVTMSSIKNIRGHSYTADDPCMHCWNTGDCAKCGRLDEQDYDKDETAAEPDDLVSTPQSPTAEQMGERKPIEEKIEHPAPGTEGEAACDSGPRPSVSTSDQGCELERAKTIPVPDPHHAIIKSLSNLKIVWKKSNPKLAEIHNGRDVRFSVYVNATVGPAIDNVTCGNLIHLPCVVESADTPGRMVEVLFVIRSKRGCAFVVFDEIKHSFSFVKPVNIIAILEHLPNRKKVARTRIDAAIVALGQGSNKVPAKRGRCEEWQATLLALLECMVNANPSDEQEAKLATLRRCMLENDKPVKKAKPAVETAHA
jgi:hypothetical protein